MKEMTDDEIMELVRDRGLGHLALAKGGDAYAIPIFYAFDRGTFYFHSHHGVKEEYLEKTGEACLVIARVDSPRVWESAQVFGSVQKITSGEELRRAEEALRIVPVPPAMGTTEGGRSRRTEEDTFVWSLEVYSMTGRKSVPESSGDDVATV